MARANIKPRKPPADDTYVDEGDDEEEFKPVNQKGSKGKKEKGGKKPKAAEEDDPFDGATEAPPAKSQAVKMDRKRKFVTMTPDRKLNKKQQAHLGKWKGVHRAKALDLFMRGHVERGKAKFGHTSVMVGGDTDKLIVGIPMYGGYDADAAKFPGCLPLEFVICQDVFPLGLVLQLVAKTGVGKSGALAEFGRWFDLAGGGLSLKEAESKFNPRWYQSIMGHNCFDHMPFFRCASVEDWQRKLTFSINDFKQYMMGTAEEPGPGRTFPMLFGVDSIMGKQSEETMDKILGGRGKDKKGKKKAPSGDDKRGSTGLGHASRGFPIEAQIITRYMRSIPAELDNWPFAIVLVNHLKIGTDDMGNEERQKAGGAQVGFQESFELELKKIGGPKKKFQCKYWEGYPIGISCEKNSFGPTHRRCMTRIRWWEEPDPKTGQWVQKTVWDWDWATVHLLNSLLSGDEHVRLKSNLKDAGFHLECPSTADIDNKAWSKNLGMKAKDALPWEDVGKLIRQDQSLQDLIRDALRINRRPLLQGDYLQQLDYLTKQLP